MLRKKFQEIKAFTLIELMIVIAIIMILAAIVIPNLLVFTGAFSKSDTQQVEIIDQSQELQLKSNEAAPTSDQGGSNNKL